MDKKEIKAKIRFGNIRRIFQGGSITWSPLTITIINQHIIAKWCGFIKIRDIPLSDVIDFEYISKKRIHLTYFYFADAIRIAYNKDGKSIEEYIVGNKKSLGEFLEELQGFKNITKKS